MVLYVAPLVKNCAKLYTQKHRYLPSLGAAMAVTPVWFTITAAFTAKSAGPPYETTVIRNRAVLPGSCRLQFQLFSEQLRVLYEFGMRSFTYSFGLLLLVLPKPLSGPLEALKSLATSTIFYWTLFMPLYFFLVCDIHLVPLLRQCGSRRWRCVHVGVHVLAMVIGHDGVTAQARTVSGHKY